MSKCLMRTANEIRRRLPETGRRPTSSVPFQLTTIEFVQKLYDSLNDNGVVAVNLVGSIAGSNGQFIRASYGTYAELFPQVLLFPVAEAKKADEVQNILLIASKATASIPQRSSNPETNKHLQNRWMGEITKDMPVLTDQYAPIDHSMVDVVKTVQRRRVATLQ